MSYIIHMFKIVDFRNMCRRLIAHGFNIAPWELNDILDENLNKDYIRIGPWVMAIHPSFWKEWNNF